MKSSPAVKPRSGGDPVFAQTLLDEAATPFLNGDPGIARLSLRDLLTASIGFEPLATMTDRAIAYIEWFHGGLPKYG